MLWEQRCFEAINGLAGAFPLLDQAGRLLAVFGLLAVILIALTLAWWPRWEPAQRRVYLYAVCAVAIIALALYGVELAVIRYVLHHEIRSAPASKVWTNLLITAEGGVSFPAWPVLLTTALTFPIWGLARRVGYLTTGLTVLLGLALIFVGAHFPLDVLAGVLVGATLGATARMLTAIRRLKGYWLPALTLWLILVLLAGGAAAMMKPQATEVAGSGTAAHGPEPSTVPTPAAVQAALQTAGAPSTVLVEAASNGHLLVASVHLTLPDTSATLDAVRQLTLRATNAAFAAWPTLDLLTLTVEEHMPGGNGQRVGILHTATVARQDWPTGGFLPTQTLPGEKYYAPRLLRKQ